MLSVLRELYDHMAWADAIVWRAVLAHPPAESDAQLRDKLIHLHTVQHAFLSIWRGMRPQWRDDFAGAADIARWATDYHTHVRAHLGSVDDGALDAPLILPWAARLVERFGHQPVDTTLRDTMLQVPMHSTYHRGQVNMRLRELGAEPPLTDYIAWIWMGKPAAQWVDR